MLTYVFYFVIISHILGDSVRIVKYKKENSGKYKIYLEDGSSLDTYEDVLINNNILYKKDINHELLNKIESDNDYQKIYNSCIKYISIRVRSVKEIREYLIRKNISSDMIDKIIDSLISKNILNDNLYTELYIKDKLNLTNWGKYKIINKLREAGIDNDIIYKYDYLFDRDEEIERIKKLINKSIKSNHKNNINFRNKIYTNLVNLGYDKELVIYVLNNLDI